MNCRVTGTGPLYVGRAMGQYSRIVYSYTYFDDVVAPGGWDDWDHSTGKNRRVCSPHQSSELGREKIFAKPRRVD